jgi:DNA-binding transcriptional ArsR family regulator
MPRPKRTDQLTEIPPLVCDDRIVHVDAVRAARNALPPVDKLAGVAALFGALADPTRIRIVAALAARELCVCDLAAALGVSESAVSHQLRLLRARGLVRTRRDGRLVYYALDDDHVSGLYGAALDHVGHGPAEASVPDRQAR